MKKKKLLWTSAATAGVLAVGGSISYAFAGGADSEPQSRMNECVVQELTLPDGVSEHGRIGAVSPSGEFIAAAADDAIVLWDDGAPRALGEDDGAPNGSTVAGVNSSGVLVGSSGGEESTAWMYAEDEVTQLPGPEGATAVEARGINDDGVIVGQVHSGETMYPVLWADPESEAEPLELPEDARADVVDVDAEGTAVGHMMSDETDGLNVGWTWPADAEGGPLPSYPDPEFYANIVAVSGEWALTVSVIDSEGPQYYHRVHLGGETEPTELRLGDGDAETGYDVWAIDDEGRAFGTDSSGQPAMQVDDEVKRLPVLGEGEGGSVHAVSADGSVAAGESLDTNGDAVPVIWTEC